MVDNVRKETILHGIERLLASISASDLFKVLVPNGPWCQRVGITPYPTLWRRECHTFYEMAYVDEGNCAIVFDDNPYLLQKGQICLIPPGQVHYIAPTATDHSYTVYWFNAMPPRIAIHASHYPGNSNCNRLLGGVDTQWGRSGERTLDFVYREFFSKDGYGYEIARGYLLALIGEICRQVSRLLEEETCSFEAWRDRVVDDVIKFIKERFTSADLSVGDMADFVALSPSYLSAYFREKTGTSPYQYLLQVRMSQARVLLQTTEQSVSTIADKAGFSSPYYFSSAFKRFHGISPTQFRRPVPVRAQDANQVMG